MKIKTTSSKSEGISLCMSQWNQKDISLLVSELKLKGGPWDNPNYPLWKEIAAKIFSESDINSIAQSLAKEVNSEFSKMIQVQNKLYATCLLGLSSNILLNYYGIERVLRISSHEEHIYDDEEDESLQDSEIKYKVIYLDDTENYLPHLDSCMEFLRADKKCLVCCNRNFFVRSLVVCVAYSLMFMENYSYKDAYKNVKPLFPGIEFTDEHCIQLQQFEQQIKMRHAKIVPLQRKVCSPKRKLLEGLILPFGGSHMLEGSPKRRTPFINATTLLDAGVASKLMCKKEDKSGSPKKQKKKLELLIPPTTTLAPSFSNSGLTPNFRPLSLGFNRDEIHLPFKNKIDSPLELGRE